MAKNSKSKTAAQKPKKKNRKTDSPKSKNKKLPAKKKELADVRGPRGSYKAAQRNADAKAAAEHRAKNRTDPAPEFPGMHSGKKWVDKLTEEQKMELGKRAWTLRLDGLSFQEIADRLDISIGLAFRLWKAVVDTVSEFTKNMVEDHIVLEVTRLDEMMAEVMPFTREHQVDEIVIRRKGENIITRVVKVTKPPSLSAIDTVLKIMERRSKLLGLDKVEPPPPGDNTTFILIGHEKIASVEDWAADKGGVFKIPAPEGQQPHELLPAKKQDKAAADTSDAPGKRALVHHVG